MSTSPSRPQPDPRVRSILALLLAALLVPACAPADEAPATDPPEPASAPAPPPPRPAGMLTIDDIRRERLRFRVEVLGFDAARSYGDAPAGADSVLLRVTNGSALTLPCLTVHTARWAGGEVVGRSRSPAVQVSGIAPGGSAEVPYFPIGHLDSVRVDSITAEVREIERSMAESTYCELRGWR